ncbi:MAG: hypothetical protein WKF92_02290 [Pyrinomonadaceae bacterium]
MSQIRLLSIIFCLLLFSSAVFSQNPVQGAVNKIVLENAGVQRSSPAYAEVVLRRTELTAELESLLLEYTEDYPKVAEMRYSLAILQKDRERILAVKAAESIKLTLALGKLMVRRAELETELWQLLKIYKEEHPDVKRAKRKVEIYESGIKDILG